MVFGMCVLVEEHQASPPPAFDNLCECHSSGRECQVALLAVQRPLILIIVRTVHPSTNVHVDVDVYISVYIYIQMCTHIHAYTTYRTLVESVSC